MSPGCLNCYAATMAGTRLANIEGQKGTYGGLTVLNNGRHVFNGTVRCLPERLTDPLGWKKPRMVFVNSMSDLFHEAVPFEFIDKIYAVMAMCEQHTFQVLTKRPERMAEYFSDLDRVQLRAADWAEQNFEQLRGQGGWGRVYNHGNPLKNVWLGTSVENQGAALARVPHLLNCDAKVLFLSVEPMLGPVNLDRIPNTSAPNPKCPGGMPSRGVGWVIVGGESGADCRLCNVQWIRSIVAQCRRTQTPCFVKQLGSNVRCPNDLTSEWLEEAELSLEHVGDERPAFQGDLVRVLLRNRKGGDPAEWPEDLRVREMPRAAAERLATQGGA